VVPPVELPEEGGALLVDAKAEVPVMRLLGGGGPKKAVVDDTPVLTLITTKPRAFSRDTLALLASRDPDVNPPAPDYLPGFPGFANNRPEPNYEFPLQEMIFTAARKQAALEEAGQKAPGSRYNIVIDAKIRPDRLPEFNAPLDPWSVRELEDKYREQLG